MSDRIIVLHEGRVTAEIARAEATEERVMFAATGQLGTSDAPATGAVAGPAHEASTAALPPDRQARGRRPLTAEAHARTPGPGIGSRIVSTVGRHES